jgi:ABC-type Mn2+/Zn2+ transport system permease subunit
MNNIKFFLPPLVFGAVCGVGVYLAQLAFHGNHKAHAIAGGVVGIVAAVAFTWTAFKAGLFKRRALSRPQKSPGTDTRAG